MCDNCEKRKKKKSVDGEIEVDKDVKPSKRVEKYIKQLEEAISRAGSPDVLEKSLNTMLKSEYGIPFTSQALEHFSQGMLYVLDALSGKTEGIEVMAINKESGDMEKEEGVIVSAAMMKVFANKQRKRVQELAGKAVENVTVIKGKKGRN